MKVAVGSKNPVKIEAVKQAFEKVFPDKHFSVEGIEVESGVSKQPMTDKESITGGRNRAHKSMQLLDADFGVGLEGGVEEIDGQWFDCGWIVVVDKAGKEGIGCTIRMHLSEKVMKHIREGKELGEVDDIIFGVTNSKQNQGHFGLMTGGAITRTSCYRDGVISALARFIKPEVFG